jgi:hypothetical protein
MNRAPTLRSPCGERVTNLGAARGAAPTQGITPPILHTRYSILSIALANQSTGQLINFFAGDAHLGDDEGAHIRRQRRRERPRDAGRETEL